jgi:uncharacterized membrane protein
MNYNADKEIERYRELKQEEIKEREKMGAMLFIPGLAIIVITILISIVGFYNAEAYLKGWQYISLCGMGLFLMILGGNE